MKLPSSFRQLLRKISHYAGPVGATTILRGCPCPPAEFHPPQPYTSSLAIDADTTLDANPVSWEPYCKEFCTPSTTAATNECYVRVNTRDTDPVRIAATCDQYAYGMTALAGPLDPWLSLCKKTCGEEQHCLIGPNAEQNNKIIINCVSWYADCAGGRSTDGIVAQPLPPSPHITGAWLAKMATLEAESIPAFQRLAHELAALGAPRQLRRRAARSRRDEMRHTRVMTSLARRHGALPASILAPRAPLPLRTLEDVAFENAIEGCIRETHGACYAWEKAQQTRDPELRATFSRIANDEIRHAALAWDIHQWAMKRLNAHQKQRITQAMHTAWQELQLRRTQSIPA